MKESFKDSRIVHCYFATGWNKCFMTSMSFMLVHQQMSPKEKNLNTFLDYIKPDLLFFLGGAPKCNNTWMSISVLLLNIIVLHHQTFPHLSFFIITQFQHCAISTLLLPFSLSFPNSNIPTPPFLFIIFFLFPQPPASIILPPVLSHVIPYLFVFYHFP